MSLLRFVAAALLVLAAAHPAHAQTGAPATAPANREGDYAPGAVPEAEKAKQRSPSPLGEGRGGGQPLARLANGIVKQTSVEGITEYRLPNGLKVLLFPDQSKPTITVNVTYLVGSRMENYGETGMAHLLEHLMFKGTKKHPHIDQEYNKRGVNF